MLICFFLSVFYIWSHWCSTYANILEKLTFHNLWYAHTCAYQGVRNASFFGKLCVHTKRMIPLYFYTLSSWFHATATWNFGGLDQRETFFLKVFLVNLRKQIVTYKKVLECESVFIWGNMSNSILIFEKF